MKTVLYHLYHQDSRGKVIAIWGKSLLQRIWREKPVPLPILLILSKLVANSHQVNGLRTHADYSTRPGADLNNPQLARMLKEEILGDWSLNVETINYLENDIKSSKPKIVLEFGSGISTLCLVQFLTEIYGKEPMVRVYSVEQDKQFAKESEQLIRSHGYDQYAKILYAPLAKVRTEGIDCFSYNLKNLANFLGNTKPDYCLIDGPSVETFDGRFATLPLVRSYLAEKAHFRMDDALRDRELSVARLWGQLSYIQLHGIVIIGKGMLTGCIGV